MSTSSASGSSKSTGPPSPCPAGSTCLCTWYATSLRPPYCVPIQGDWVIVLYADQCPLEGIKPGCCCTGLMYCTSPCGPAVRGTYDGETRIFPCREYQ
jgi:hypothetical protein